MRAAFTNIYSEYLDIVVLGCVDERSMTAEMTDFIGLVQTGVTQSIMTI